ncbi:MAG: hypothetical protein GWN00_26400, partial [Aliifodinibius sp.]|nr:hypothetical protein [Fodinibius sp.]NIV14384.1 hypothetical protein [Fodinibius sp.]NIY28204.1 hypothetical protein [Fodinibius sp.]
VTDSSVTGTIDSIPAGPHRKFEIFVYDEDTTLTYSGEAFSDVPAGAVLTLQIVLYPVDHTGTVIIVGTFAPFPPSNDYALEFDGIDDWVNVGDRDQLEFD